jgi:hypothetical protein
MGHAGLLKADAIVVVGSNDPTYTASKLFPYVLTHRPMLLLFHQQSAVLKFAQEVEAGLRFAFSDEGDVAPRVAEVYDRWFVKGGCRAEATFNVEKFLPFTASALTAKLAAIFDRAAAPPLLP